MLPCSNGPDVQAEALKLGEALASIAEGLTALEGILGGVADRLAGLQRLTVALSEKAQAEAAELGRS